MNWFKRLKTGLSKSSNKITSGIGDIFTKRKLDTDMLEELEELLISADIGVATSTKIVSEFGKNRFDKEIEENQVREILAQQIAQIISPVSLPLTINETAQPHVIMMVGVNGNGKTTTTGKLAQRYSQQGKKVMIVACDTFRAAAVEQLQIWGERANCTVITGKQNSEPASVAYAALQQAIAENIDVLLIDTAGRLQNKKDLMNELSKISRVLKKLDDNSPHDTILVLDATTGQNAHNQVKAFKEVVDISGLIVTKLDGTAKGGVVVALADSFKTPIHFIGVGESIEDLDAFEADIFARNLMGLS